MDAFGLNGAVYAHAMKRAMETLREVLETRLNDHGYALQVYNHDLQQADESISFFFFQ